MNFPSLDMLFTDIRVDDVLFTSLLQPVFHFARQRLGYARQKLVKKPGTALIIVNYVYVDCYIMHNYLYIIH